MCIQSSCTSVYNHTLDTSPRPTKRNNCFSKKSEVKGMYYSRLKDLREDNDLVQKQIADVLGIDQRVYSNYETGKREIPTRLVVMLAKYYKTSTDYILGLTDKP